MSHISLQTGRQKECRYTSNTVKTNGKGGGIPRTEMGESSVWCRRSCGEGHRDVNEKGKPRAKECKVKVFGYAYGAPT